MKSNYIGTIDQDEFNELHSECYKIKEKITEAINGLKSMIGELNSSKLGQDRIDDIIDYQCDSLNEEHIEGLDFYISNLISYESILDGFLGKSE